MSKSIWLKDEDQKGNFSNQKQDTFDPGKGYLGIRLQQGAPLLDRDWNELEDIRRYAEVMLRKYFIGNGVPDENGFRIEAAETPANDFKILAGRCLVEGFEVVNEPVDADGNPLDFILYSQQEGVEPLSVPDVDRSDTVYLDVWIEEVTGQQEAALNNPQDINVETCTRHKLNWRVKVNEGTQGLPGEAFHHYYAIARIARQAGKQTIDAGDIEDLRLTGLALHLIKKVIDAVGWVTTAKIADKAVTNAKLNDGSVNEDKLSTVVRGKLVTNGNDHNHSGGDGATINHSDLNLDDGPNPHQVGMSQLIDFDANNNKITNLIDPTEDKDAANKGYVDSMATAANIGAITSINEVKNPGGNINLVSGNEIEIIPDNLEKTITIKENHSTNMENPHQITAEQVGALSNEGGFVTGSIHIKTTDWYALSGNATKTYGIMGRLTEDLETGSQYRTAGVVGISEIEGKHGVYAKAPEGTHALYVQGSAFFSGAKTGYVVDVFKNASGKTLKSGDVVKIKGTPVSRFFGDNDKIPVAEVTLGDKENDNCTIGIVDRKSIPDEIDTGKKSKAGDPTVIKSGEELFVVTLGTYARCKVDASEAPIKAGDLLTSSSNPGHAKKAADPKIGSIIGKALEPLEKGTGYIAVFVNIQ